MAMVGVHLFLYVSDAGPSVIEWAKNSPSLKRMEKAGYQ